jgi:hypothetical protein
MPGRNFLKAVAVELLHEPFGQLIHMHAMPEFPVLRAVSMPI